MKVLVTKNFTADARRYKGKLKLTTKNVAQDIYASDLEQDVLQWVGEMAIEAGAATPSEPTSKKKA